MAKNEFGVESSNSGGFGAGVGSDFEEQFERAIAASVVDDEVSDTRRSRRMVSRDPEPTPSFEAVSPEPEVEADLPSFNVDPEPEPAPQEYAAPESTGFGQIGDIDSMFDEAEQASVEEDEDDTNPLSFFDDFGTASQHAPEQVTELEPVAEFPSWEESEPEQFEGDTAEQWIDPAIAADFDDEPEMAAPPVLPQPPQAAPISEPVYEQQSVAAPVAPEPSPVAPESELKPEPVYYEPTVSEPRPSVEPDHVPVPKPEIVEPEPVAQFVPEGDPVDYIERVILTSDAIRDLPEDDAKAVNLFITGGQPVGTHQELVLAALSADRQILKTADAILEAKSKSSVDRAFHILGLDDTTFVDFGKILSHDLESTETVTFEGDRLQYARKLVDVVEMLPTVSIKRFEAVKSVLGAGELAS